MKQVIAASCLFTLYVLISPLTASPQAAVGIQPFGSYDSNFDVVDLATLSSHIDIPLYVMKGRGTFGTKVHLLYDTGYSDQGNTNYAPANFGWRIIAGTGS